jgi:hypothetical protein
MMHTPSLLTFLTLSFFINVHSSQEDQFLAVTPTEVHLEVKKELHKALSGLTRPSYEVYHLSKIERWDVTCRIFLSWWTANKNKEKQTYPVFLENTHAHTVFGSVYRALQQDSLSSPEINQTLLAFLAQEKTLLKTLHGLLNAIRKSESALLSFWEGEKYPEKNHINRLYSKNGHPYSFKDTSPSWQEFFTNIQHFKCIGQIIGGGAGVFCGSSYVEKYSKSPFYGKAAISIASGILGSYAQVVLFPQEKEFCYLLNYLHEKTNSMALVIQVLDTVSHHSQKCTAFENLECAPLLKALQTPRLSPKLTRLIALLRTPTFKGEPSFFSRKGRVRAAYALINELRDELIPFLIALGEIDRYVSLAHPSLTA